MKVAQKGPLRFDDYTILEKAEKDKKNKSDVREIIKRRYKSEGQKSSIKNVKTFYKSRGKVIQLFIDYSQITSKATYKSIYEEGLPSDFRLSFVTQNIDS